MEAEKKNPTTIDDMETKQNSLSPAESVVALSSDDVEDEITEAASEDDDVRSRVDAADDAPPDAHPQSAIITPSRLYNAIEDRIAANVQPAFAFVMDDPTRNAPLLFVCGLMAGGVGGSRLAAFGVGSAVCFLNCDVLRVTAIVALAILAMAWTEGTLELVGFFQVGAMAARVAVTRRLVSDVASGLTTGVIACFAPSVPLILWIVGVHAYCAVR